MKFLTLSLLCFLLLLAPAHCSKQGDEGQEDSDSILRPIIEGVFSGIIHAILQSAIDSFYAMIFAMEAGWLQTILILIFVGVPILLVILGIVLWIVNGCRHCRRQDLARYGAHSVAYGVTRAIIAR